MRGQRFARLLGGGSLPRRECHAPAVGLDRSLDQRAGPRAPCIAPCGEILAVAASPAVVGMILVQKRRLAALPGGGGADRGETERAAARQTQGAREGGAATFGFGSVHSRPQN